MLLLTLVRSPPIICFKSIQEKPHPLHGTELINAKQQSEFGPLLYIVAVLSVVPAALSRGCMPTVCELFSRHSLSFPFDSHAHFGKVAQIFTLSQLTETKAPTPNHGSTAGLDH